MEKTLEDITKDKYICMQFCGRLTLAELAAMMIDEKYITNIRFHPDGSKVTFNTDQRDQFFDLLNRLIVEQDLEISEIISPDDNLQAVFDYLVGK